MAFEVAASDKRRLLETAMVIRRIINESRRECEQMPWPPSAAWLLSGARRPPEILLTFLIFLITWKPAKVANGRSQRHTLSFAEDICYAAMKGDCVMSKYLTLPVTIRHLTGSDEVSLRP